MKPDAIRRSMRLDSSRSLVGFSTNSSPELEPQARAAARTSCADFAAGALDVHTPSPAPPLRAVLAFDRGEDVAVVREALDPTVLPELVGRFEQLAAAPAPPPPRGGRSAMRWRWRRGTRHPRAGTRAGWRRCRAARRPAASRARSLGCVVWTRTGTASTSTARRKSTMSSRSCSVRTAHAANGVAELGDEPAAGGTPFRQRRSPRLRAPTAPRARGRGSRASRLASSRSGGSRSPGPSSPRWMRPRISWITSCGARRRQRAACSCRVAAQSVREHRLHAGDERVDIRRSGVPRRHPPHLVRGLVPHVEEAPLLQCLDRVGPQPSRTRC